MGIYNYYSQHRENGKVVSKYLGAVKPGSIADEEKKADADF